MVDRFDADTGPSFPESNRVIVTSSSKNDIQWVSRGLTRFETGHRVSVLEMMGE